MVALPWDPRGARRRMDARRNGGLGSARSAPGLAHRAGLGAPANAAAGGPKKTYAAARPPFASCQGVRIRGPAAVIAIVNSKWAASDPSWE